ncbi:MAG: hypothetical protein M3032_12700 [Verrucomicrobiota bacterium]|nr:hypothetical protein [Verrucomicrobiota bacterium]
MSARHSISLAKRLRYRGEWLGVRAVAFTIPLFPRSVALALANFCGAAAAYLHLSGRRVALSNLRAVFPEMPIARRRALVRQSYQHFARAQADLFWSPGLKGENVREIFDLAELDRFKREQGDRPVIFCCLHYGGFELVAVAFGHCGLESTLITQDFKNKLLGSIFESLREHSGHQTVRRERALVRLFKALRTGRSVGLAVDLTIPPNLPSVPVRCLGLLTSMTFGHAFLHRRSGAPIVPTYCEPLPDGRYRVVLRPPLEFDESATDQEIAQACWDSLEPALRRHPAPWLWMYKHWRYRPMAAPRESYPDYANESTWFEVRLARAAEEKLRRAATTQAAAG